MKQYLNSDQTTKLIELGFEKPPKKGLLFQSNIGNCHTNLMLAEENYSIGELISFIPEKIESEEDDCMATFQMTAGWEIYYTTYSDIFYYFNNVELVDALFDMIIKLKEEGVI